MDGNHRWLLSSYLHGAAKPVRDPMVRVEQLLHYQELLEQELAHVRRELATTARQTLQG